MGNAIAAFEEDIKGSLTPGKLADITILSQDLLAIPDEDILNTAQVIHPDDISRTVELGVIPAVQGIFAYASISYRGNRGISQRIEYIASFARTLRPQSVFNPGPV